MGFVSLVLKIMHIPAKINWLIAASTLKKIGTGSGAGAGFQAIGGKYISVGNNYAAGKNVSLQAWKMNDSNVVPKLNIGNNVVMADNSFISCANTITIGDGTLMGVNAFICDNSHGANIWEERNTPPARRQLVSKGPVTIGRNVWIGRNVCILSGVTIGDGAIIGANAVVTKSIPAYSIAAGIPAKIIRTINNDKLSNIEHQTV